MRLLKFNIAFVALNALLIALVNYSISGGLTFMFFLSLWVVSVAVFNLSIRYLLGRSLRSIKPVYFFVLVCLIGFVLSNIFIASFDPNNIGLIANLISTYKDTGTLYLIVLPYFSALVIVCAWCIIAERSAKNSKVV